MSEKYCPILIIGKNEYMSKCIQSNCTWWCSFAEACAIPLLAEMFADSSICRSVFEIDGGCNG